MKVDRNRLKKGTSEVSAECQSLIDKLYQCDGNELLQILSTIKTWTFGKCELYHWVDILDKFDAILEEATVLVFDKIPYLSCDESFSPEKVKLLLLVLNFTTLLIEHSFSRHLYNSVEHLTTLLSSTNMNIILGVLNLLYMFSKRSNFISRLQSVKKSPLLNRLKCIAEVWGFGLGDCCRDDRNFSESASTVYFEYLNKRGVKDYVLLENIMQYGLNIRQLADRMCYGITEIDDDQRYNIFSRIRLAASFREYDLRLLFVQARLQALSILVYSDALAGYSHTLIYPGFLQELVELLELQIPHLVEIRAAALRTLTSIIHLERNSQYLRKTESRLNTIIEVTGATSYHGFLPTLVRTCIKTLTSSTGKFSNLSNNIKGCSSGEVRTYSKVPTKIIPNSESSVTNENENTNAEEDTEPGGTSNDSNKTDKESDENQREEFPLQLATALFSFLYHLASYEPGAESLVSCGMMESLLRVINWSGTELEHITFVTRAVRVIDLITNIDMQSFQAYDGITSFIDRLGVEVNLCRLEQSFEIQSNVDIINNELDNYNSDMSIENDIYSNENPTKNDPPITVPIEESASRVENVPNVAGAADNDHMSIDNDEFPMNNRADETLKQQKPIKISSNSAESKNVNNRTCLPQRAALLKSMLNFLKKGIPDSTFNDVIRHVMETTLPMSLKHIISNAEYYGPSLFLLATDVVSVYVFQEPSLLSSLQENGLTDVVLQALLKKDVPATREVLGSIPNVFSALCLNARGLESFITYMPFEKLFRVLLSPTYLSAMRRRRSSDPMGDTATNLGNAMDELMRNQPSLKSEAIRAIIELLEDLVHIGTDPKYVCWRAQNKNDITPSNAQNPRQDANNARSSNVTASNSVDRLNAVTNRVDNADVGGSDEDDDDDEEESPLSQDQQLHNITAQPEDEENYNSPSISQPHCIDESCPNNENVNARGSLISTISDPQYGLVVTKTKSNERIPIALIDYILNVMKFIDAILSNNSTDDHCREFIMQGGLKPLLSILSLPNLPVTSCNLAITATAQAVATVCKSILNLAGDPAVLQTALKQLAVVVDKLTPLNCHLEEAGGSVLLRELANCPNIDEAFSNASYTPLLHAMSAVHGYVVMLVHVCRTGQSEIRQLSLLEWGKDNDYGKNLLKKLVQLYTALVWESTLLLALCTDDIIPADCDFGKEDMEKLITKDSTIPKNNTSNSETTSTFAASTAHRHSADINWNDIMINLSTNSNNHRHYQIHESNNSNASDIDGAAGGSSSSGSRDVDPAASGDGVVGSSSTSSSSSNSMDIDSNDSTNSNSRTNPTTGNIDVLENNPVNTNNNKSSINRGSGEEQNKDSPEANTSKRIVATPAQLKYIKSLLGASSRLGRALAELFGLLVKLCVGSPIRQRRGQNYTPNISPASKEIARVLSYILVDGLSFTKIPPSPIPKLKLTFLICSVGFTSPMLFDDKKFAYHLMLEKFCEEGGLTAFFEMFKWALTAGHTLPIESAIEDPSLPDGTGEFLDSWLLLLEKMVNPKSILESPHIIINKDGLQTPQNPIKNEDGFNSMQYLINVQNYAFYAIMNLWGFKPLKTYGLRMSESILAIFKHIIKSELIVDLDIKRRIEISKFVDKKTTGGLSRQSISEMIALGALSGTRLAIRSGSPPRNGTEPSTQSIPTSIFTETSGLIGSVIANHDINDDDLRHLIDMGFNVEQGRIALWRNNGNLEQAMESLLNREIASDTSTSGNTRTTATSSSSRNSVPQTSRTTASSQLTTTRNESNSIPGFNRNPNSMLIPALRSLGPLSFSTTRSHGVFRFENIRDLDESYALSASSNDMYPYRRSNPVFLSARTVIPVDATPSTSRAAIAAANLHPSVMVSIPANNSDRSYVQEDNIYEMHDYKKEIPVPKKDIDNFCNNALEISLNLLNELPETVYRVCDLIVIILKRNGLKWSEKMLNVLILDIISCLEFLQKVISWDKMFAKDVSYTAEQLISSEIASKAAVRIHLLILLLECEYQEIRISCGMAMQNHNLLSRLICVVTDYESLMTEHGKIIATPKWVAPVFLLIDLFENISSFTLRKYDMHKVTVGTWQWYDITAARWNPYNKINTNLINDAYIGGANNLRIYIGGQRYTINFNSMSQVNDETGSHRPIIMTLKCLAQKNESSTPNSASSSKPKEDFVDKICGDKPCRKVKISKTDKQPTIHSCPMDDTGLFSSDYKDDIEDDSEVSVINRLIHGLKKEESENLLQSCVKLISLNVESDLLHAIMRVLLRLTRTYSNAVLFVREGGIKLLLHLSSSSFFLGFNTLVTLLIRHVLEDEKTLNQAFEQVLITRTLSTIPTGYKDLIYMTRQMCAAISRDPLKFTDVAKSILRIDKDLLKVNQLPEDERVIVKSIIPTFSTNEQHQRFITDNECAIEVINDLLAILIIPENGSSPHAAAGGNLSQDDMADKKSNTSRSRPNTRSTNRFSSSRSAPTTGSSNVHVSNHDCGDTTNNADGDNNANSKTPTMNKTLLSKGTILKILSGAVRSYPAISLLITEHIYSADSSPLITKKVTALSFIFDKLLNMDEGNRDCATHALNLITALASCTDVIQAQYAVVVELKLALRRALIMSECAEKHTQIEVLCNLIPAMIENCHDSPMMKSAIQQQQIQQNAHPRLNIFYMMVRQGLLTDLSRATQSLDLSGPNTVTTLNYLLRPLELLIRMTNEQVPAISNLEPLEHERRVFEALRPEFLTPSAILAARRQMNLLRQPRTVAHCFNTQAQTITANSRRFLNAIMNPETVDDEEDDDDDEDDDDEEDDNEDEDDEEENDESNRDPLAQSEDTESAVNSNACQAARIDIRSSIVSNNNVNNNSETEDGSPSVSTDRRAGRCGRGRARCTRGQARCSRGQARCSRGQARCSRGSGVNRIPMRLRDLNDETTSRTFEHMMEDTQENNNSDDNYNLDEIQRRDSAATTETGVLHYLESSAAAIDSNSESGESDSNQSRNNENELDEEDDVEDEEEDVEENEDGEDEDDDDDEDRGDNTGHSQFNLDESRRFFEMFELTPRYSELVRESEDIILVQYNQNDSDHNNESNMIETDNTDAASSRTGAANNADDEDDDEDEDENEDEEDGDNEEDDDTNNMRIANNTTDIPDNRNGNNSDTGRFMYNRPIFSQLLQASSNVLDAVGISLGNSDARTGPNSIIVGSSNMTGNASGIDNSRSSNSAHPLLVGRSSTAMSASAQDILRPESSGHTHSRYSAISNTNRNNRGRVFEYINFDIPNPLGLVPQPNPPVILQRLLGPQGLNINASSTGRGSGNSANHTANTIYRSSSPDFASVAAAAATAAFRDATRVVLMDNGFGIFSQNEEDQIEVVDQAGYFFGRNLQPQLNNTPTALHWWIEEAKVLGLETQTDICLTVCDRIITEFKSLDSVDDTDDTLCKRKKKLSDEENSESAQKCPLTRDSTRFIPTRIIRPSDLIGSSNSNRPSVPLFIPMQGPQRIPSALLSPAAMRQRTLRQFQRCINPVIRISRLSSEEIMELQLPAHALRHDLNRRRLEFEVMEDEEENVTEQPNEQVPETLIENNVDAEAADVDIEGSASCSSSEADCVLVDENGRETPYKCMGTTTRLPRSETDTESEPELSSQTSETQNNLVTNTSPQPMDISYSPVRELSSTSIISISSDEGGEEDTLVETNNYSSDKIEDNNIAQIIHNSDSESESESNTTSTEHHRPQSSVSTRGVPDGEINETDSDSDAEVVEIVNIRPILIKNSTASSEAAMREENEETGSNEDDIDEGNRNANMDKSSPTVGSCNKQEINTKLDNNDKVCDVEIKKTIEESIKSAGSVAGASSDTKLEAVSSCDEEEDGAVGGEPSNSLPSTSRTSSVSVPSVEKVAEIDPSIRSILGDLEVPEGVDPSFLAALPNEMREEVIAEHLRVQRMRQRTQQQNQSSESLPSSSSANRPNSSQNSGNAMSNIEVNQEFLAALPLNIQEEVLNYQRLEQQRQAANEVNPDDPVDTVAFFQNLQPNLRQAILSDMDDSQIAVLPPELAAEAQTLRRMWEARNRRVVQDRTNDSRQNLQRQNVSRTFSGDSNTNNGNNASGSNNGAASTHANTGEGSIPTSRPRPGAMMNIEMDRYGEPLLDFESLSSILVLLFIDDPNLSTVRLYRVIRNLCYHVPTRNWIIASLLTIIEKCNEKDSPDINLVSPQSTAHRPQWLNIYLDAALGARANTFILKKYFVPRFESKKPNNAASTSSNTSSPTSANVANDVDKGNTTIIVQPNEMLLHWKATHIICRHVIELLVFLAKLFSTQFLPSHTTENNDHFKKKSDTDNIMSCITSVIDSALMIPGNMFDESAPSTSTANKNIASTLRFKMLAKNLDEQLSKLNPNIYVSDEYPNNFWDIIMRVDSTAQFRRYNSESALVHSINKIKVLPPSATVYPAEYISPSGSGSASFTHVLQLSGPKIPNSKKSASDKKKRATEENAVQHTNFYQSSFGKLIEFLSFDIIQQSTQLTDKLLRLLGIISITYPINLHTSAFSINSRAQIKRNELCLKMASGSAVNREDDDDEEVEGEDDCEYEEESEKKNSTSKSNATDKTKKKTSTKSNESDDVQIDVQALLPESYYHLRMAVDILTSKFCSEEGLEDATVLLISLSQCSKVTRNMILNLLIHGAKSLAATVQQQISNLMRELKYLKESNNKKNKKSLKNSNSDDPQSSASSTMDEKTSKLIGGLLQDRFTQDQVIISTPNKLIKTAYDLQLSSMCPLKMKASSQAFFLRILKVVTQIRDTEFTPIFVETSEVSDAFEVLPLSDILSLHTLWDTLSDCLHELEETPDHHAVLVLQPAVEAFFLVHSSQYLQDNKSTGQRRSSVSSFTSSASQQDVASSSQNSNGSATQPTSQPNPVANQTPEETAPTPSTENNPAENMANSQTSSVGPNTNIVPVSPIPVEQQSSSPSCSKQSSDPASLASVTLTPDQKKFLKFAETHKVVLNQILRQTTTHLADGPFAVLVDHIRILDFDVKRRYFRTELERLDDGVRRDELAVHVHRVTVFEDSFRELYRRNPEEWKNRFYIVFEDEEGQDAGGLLREWYVIMSREIFNPMYALFTVSPGDRVTYMINPSSYANPNHLCYYKFVGRFTAKAIYDNKLLECYFTRSFYKHILGIPVTHTDIKSEDYAFYQGLEFLKENHVSSLGYDLTFSLEIQEFGVTEVRDLIPNGRNIHVTEDNKLEYIKLVCQLKMSGSKRQQLNAFLEGFYEIIPKHFISIFTEQELELLISGLPNIDIEDLRANTEYHKYQVNSIQIQWFWRALRSFDQADRAKFLQFVTGTSKVPLQGFATLEGMNGIQKLQIHRDDRGTDRLPSAHTCFNQLDLPVYKTYDKLRSCLLKAIHECSEGFGFA